MLENDETSALCHLATEFANVARLYRHAAQHHADADCADLLRQSDVRQAAADRIVADFAPEKLPAEGSWLPSVEEVEFRLKSLIDQGWAKTALGDADQQLLARISDLLSHGRPSNEAAEVIYRARETLSAHVQSQRITRTSDQPG